MTPEAKPLRVLAVIPGTGTGSSMIFARKQMAAVAAQGVSVKTFFLASRMNPFALWKERAELKRIIRDFDPHIVHAHYGTMTAFLVTISTSRPKIITFQGSDLNYTPHDGILRDFFGRMLSQVAAMRAKKSICVSEKLRMRLWSRKRSVTLPVGIDTTLFCPQEKSEARKKTGWDMQEKVVLFNANNPVVKRLDLAEAAMMQVREAVPDARLEVMRGNIDPSEIPVMLNASDAVLLCSDSEGSPMIIKEAMACNIPVCATDVGDVKERISGVEGCMLVPQDVSAIAAGLISLLQQERRSNGREHLIRQQLDERQSVQKLINIYQTVIFKKS